MNPLVAQRQRITLKARLYRTAPLSDYCAHRLVAPGSSGGNREIVARYRCHCMVCRHVGAAAAGTDGGSGAGGEALYYARGGIAWANYRYTSFWGGERAFYEANQL